MSNIPENYKKAVKSALNMLAYADNTAKSLLDKLSAKYSYEEAEYAVRYVAEQGFLNETRYLERLVEFLATKKLFGRRRIILESYKKGFSRELSEKLLPEMLKKYDFTELCLDAAKRLKKDSADKLFAALLRLGHSSSDASEAVKKVFFADSGDD